jgi:hypothetical protein
MMRRSIQQPRSDQAALLKNRCTIPNHIFVARPNVHDISSSQQFNYDALNRSTIEAHFQRNVASSFISLYESKKTASRKRPYIVKVREDTPSYEAIVVDVDTSGMVPAWMSIGNGVHIPVWFEEVIREPEEGHHEEVLWFCLEEVKKVLSMDVNLGEKGEWLACGYIPQSRVIIHSTSSNSEPLQRVSNDEEKYGADRQAHCERIRVENERLQLDQKRLERMAEKAQSSCSFKVLPSIPTRKSSLGSLACKDIGERKKEVSAGSKITCKTRNVRITVTNADPHSAASLMKYAILMAHGRKTEGEETWHAETASLAGDSNRSESILTIENEVPNEKRSGFTARHVGTPMTPPASPKERSRQLDKLDRRRHGNGKDLTLRHELAQRDDGQCLEEEPRSLRRSAAPSPSHSMLKSHHERGNVASFQDRRSRRDLLIELQSDQDSVLREYAQFSLQDPIILQQVHDHSRHDSTSYDAESRTHNQEDSQSPIPLSNHPTASTPSFLVPAHHPHSTHDTQNKGREPPRVVPPAPSSHSTTTSLSSLSDSEHASIGRAVYVSVEPASHINKVDNIRSGQKSVPGLKSDSSDRQWSVQSSPAPRFLEPQADAVLELFPALNPWAQPEQPGGEENMPPQTMPAPTVFPAVSAPTPTPAPVPSKGEAFLARAKCLGEKGREITSRIAEIKERQHKSEAKKDKWGLSKWRSGEKRKDGNKRLGDQNEQS